jgi:hypothetical protein
MKKRRTTSAHTLGDQVSSEPVRHEKTGLIVMSGLRPSASLSPPSTGLNAKVRTPVARGAVRWYRSRLKS